MNRLELDDLDALLRATFRAEAVRQVPDDRPTPAAPLPRVAPVFRLRRRWIGVSAVAAGLVAAVAAAVFVGHEALDAAPGPTPAASPSASVVLQSSSPATPSPSPTTGATATATGSAATGANPAPGPVGGPVPAGFVPTSATFVSADEGWVLGTTPTCATAPCTSVVRTRDGGRTWVGIPAPRATLSLPPSTLDQVGSIRFANALDGWVFGRQLWATHDGGASWHQVSGVVGDDRSISDLQTSGGSVYLLLGVCTPQSGGDATCATSSAVEAAATTSDTFTTLVTVPNGTASRNWLTVHGSDWWVSAQGALYHGSGRTAPGRLAPICSAEQQPGLVTAADSTHLDGLCAGQGAGGSLTAQLRGSTDGGRSWTDAGRAFRAPSGLAQISDNAAGVLLLAASSGDSELYRTTDDGGSFSTVVQTNAGEGQPWSDAGFTTPDQAFAVLPGQAMYLSTDAGASWGTVVFRQ